MFTYSFTEAYVLGDLQRFLVRLRADDIAVATLAIPTDDREIDSLQKWLSSEERHRADRLCCERDRASYVGAHALLSALISILMGERGIGWELECAHPGTKPYLRADSASRHSVNLSHTDGLAVVVLSLHGDVGVDIERVRDVDMSNEEMAELLTSRERFLLQDGPMRNRAFLRFWTRKEACLKALGVGLSVAPALVETSSGTHFLVQGMENQIWGADIAIGADWVGCVCALARPNAIQLVNVDLSLLLA